MSEHYSQTHDDADDTVASDESSFLATQFRSGTVAFAVAALAMLRALGAGRSRPGRTVIYTITAGLFVALGAVQRRQDGADDPQATSPIDDDEAVTTTESLDGSAGDTGGTGITTEELSDPESPEDNTDADVSSTKVADEPAEAVGPSSEDAMPEQTGEGTEPDATPGEDVTTVDPDDPDELDGRGADESDDRSADDADESDDRSTDEDDDT